jgi:hypothetical protein
MIGGYQDPGIASSRLREQGAEGRGVQQHAGGGQLATAHRVPLAHRHQAGSLRCFEGDVVDRTHLGAVYPLASVDNGLAAAASIGHRSVAHEAAEAPAVRAGRFFALSRVGLRPLVCPLWRSSRGRAGRVGAGSGC